MMQMPEGNARTIIEIHIVKKALQANGNNQTTSAC
jgi:hypothetical protein